MLLNCAQITKIQPLNRLFCIGSRLTDIITIHRSHLFELLQKGNLLKQFFTLADGIRIHYPHGNIRFIFFLFLNQAVNTIKRNPAIVPDNTPSAVSIRQTGDDPAFSGLAHFV